MFYNKIINPKTGRKVNIGSKLGQNILNNFILELRGGTKTTELKERLDVIIDCDPGVDDMLALMLALSPYARDVTEEGPEQPINVIAITCVFGNQIDPDILERNARFAIKLTGHHEIPVIMGARKPLYYDFLGKEGMAIHGNGGIGGAVLEHDKPVENIQLQRWERGEWFGTKEGEKGMYAPRVLYPKPKNKEDYLSRNEAAEYIKRMVEDREDNDKICLVTLGPFTNLADAIILGLNTNQIHSVFSMGGSFGIPGGNAFAASECNVGNDIDAAKIVLTEPNYCKMVLVPLNLTHQLELEPLRQNFKEVESTSNGYDVSNFLFRMTDHYCNTVYSYGQTENPIHDPATVMALINPSLFTNWKKQHVDVETRRCDLGSAVALGATIADWNGHWTNPSGFKGFRLQYTGRPDRQVGSKITILRESDAKSFNETYMTAIKTIQNKAESTDIENWLNKECDCGECKEMRLKFKEQGKRDGQELRTATRARRVAVNVV